MKESQTPAALCDMLLTKINSGELRVTKITQ